MPQSKSPGPSDVHHESDIIHPTQEPVSQMVEAHVLGGESNNIDSSMHESPQPSSTNSITTGCAVDINGNACADDPAVAHDKNELEGALKNVDLAVLLLAKCKVGISLQLANLDNAVFLFRQVIDNHPTTHPLHTNAMRNLASALGVRFMYTNQVQDLMESLDLCSKMFNVLNFEKALSSTNITVQKEDKLDTEDILELPKRIIRDFQKSTSLDVLNNIVSLVQQAVVHLPSAHTSWFMALETLADGFYVRFCHSCDIADLNKAISSLQDAVRYCPELYWQRPNMHYQICGLLAARFNLMGNIFDLQMALDWFKNANIEGPKTFTGILQWLEFATEMCKQFTKSGNITDLNTAVTLFREGIAELPVGSENYSCALGNLASALRTRFGQAGQQSDLDEAISLHRKALELQIPPHPLRFTSLGNLATALSIRFEEGGQKSDLDEAISLHMEAFRLQLPPYPQQATLLSNLASTLWIRFKNGGQLSDLNGAIYLHREALELRLPPHPNRSMSLNNLAAALCTRFEQGGQQGDLEEAISMHREALKLQLPPHPLRSSSLNNLANALSTRFEQGGQQSDLDEAIFLHREDLELQLPPHPNQSSSLNNLANALWTRFKQGGQQSDLDEAISLHTEALKFLLLPHPLQPGLLNNLANTLLTQFEQGGQQSDLDKAISLHREALKLRPPPHPDRSMSLKNLATTLWTQFKQGGQQCDLDEAISLHREALELQLPPHPSRSISLNNLASALWTRFEQGGQKSDLGEAISLHREALKLQLSPHPDRSNSLNNLANALWIQFHHGGQQSDINEAISLHRGALELRLPRHPNRSSSLNNLANALWIRFHHGGQKSDINESISLHREALELFLPYPHRSSSLNNLANALLSRFQQGGQQSDINEAISLHREALELRLSPHPDRSGSLNNLAFALMTRFEKEGQQSDIDEAMHSFLAATKCLFQSPSCLLNIAKRWIHHAEKNNHNSLLDAYDTALLALPQVAALSLDVQSRQQALIAGSDGLARDASRCAILAGHLDKAIEFLEAGRSIFWSQFLSLRSPFNQLHDIEPGLADRLQDIATALEIGSHRDISAQISDNQMKLTIDQEASRMNRLNEEWVKSIDEVRKLKGFEHFLCPSPLSSFQPAASKHPVVILIASEKGSHCLIMTLTNVHHIPLPNLHTSMLKELGKLVQGASSQWPSSRSFIEATQEKILQLMTECTSRMPVRINSKLGSSDDVFRFVLKILWDELVNPVINLLKIKKLGKILPVLQWCTTGHFTFLPIHAAGFYDGKQAIDCAFDYFISSYTPTIGTLLGHESSVSPQIFKMIVVIQSQDLPCTRMELASIRRHVSSSALIELGDSGVPAKVEAVANCLPGASIVHFACHGIQNALRPLDSGLQLDDGQLQISRIMQEKMLNGALAFLCACETAKVDETLPDEVLSLGASLIFSGFQRVVATMWEMMDEDGPTIADAFYEELFCGSEGKQGFEPDMTKSALALHLAVRKLCVQNISFRRWVPFIHIGK